MNFCLRWHVSGISIIEGPLTWPARKESRSLKTRESFIERVKIGVPDRPRIVSRKSRIRLPISPSYPQPLCLPAGRFKFIGQRGFALMNIQRNESTVFSIYQRHSLPICSVDCPSLVSEFAKRRRTRVADCSLKIVLRREKRERRREISLAVRSSGAY